MRQVFRESTRQTATTMLLIASAYILNYAITNERLADSLVAAISAMQLSPMQFMAVVNLFFLILGCFLDGSVMMLVFVPLLMPSVRALGIDVTYFGIVVTLNIMIGLITPPYGLLLFVLARVAGLSFERTTMAILPWLIPLLVSLVVLTYVPSLVLWLPRQFF